MTITQDVVQSLEDFFLDCMTRTPLTMRFTAADVAAYLQCDTSEVSHWLQRYRDVQGNLVPSASAQFVIATFNRGRYSEWFILGWPNMSQKDRTLAGGLLVTHEIMSSIKEDMDPMLRNVEVQFIPAYLNNKRINRALIPAIQAKLHGYSTTLMDFRQQLHHLTPLSMQRIANGLEALLDLEINRVDSLRAHLATL